MNIVFVSREYPPSLRGGGISSYVRIVAEGLAARGHRVTVVAANDDTRRESRENVNGVDVIRLQGGDFLIPQAEPGVSKLKKFRYAYRFWSYRRRILKALRELDDIDVVEVAEFGAEGLYLDKLGKPIVYRLHTPALLDHNDFNLSRLNRSNLPYYYFGKKELSLLRNKAKHITSCSSSLREWAMKYLDIPGERITTIYNPLQPDFFSAYKENADVERDRVFFAGTVCDWKGSEDLYDAVKILNDGGRHVRLEMAGKTGAFGEALKEKGRESDWFGILGKVDQSKLKDMYRQAGVVCFPSWWENMPMVCLEAMAVGGIVIGSDSGGMAEIIEDGKSGFLLPPKNPERWAEKIAKVLDMDNDAREAMSRNARERIREVFSLERILDEMEGYYSTILR